jgi:CheY-like chemotaxis protein
VLVNLLGNALKFTERGHVLVRVAPEAETYGGLRLRFDVVDTGIGIDAQTLPHLFEPFRQADATTTRRYGGSGLGLNIVRHLTTLMAGRVECDSREGEGSRFSIVVPMPHAPVPDTPHGAPTHALVYAEDARRLALLRTMAEELDADVATASSDVELAARLDGGAHPDVLVIDKRTTLARQVLAGLPTTVPLGGIPVVVVREHAAHQDAPPRVVQVEGNPLTRAQLLGALEAALGRRRPVARIEVPRARVLANEAAARLGRLILLADDHPVNREVVALQLQQLGYACDAVEDGEQAWARLQADRARYALLLTDCHMPRLDGFALTRRIRDAERAGAWAPLPIVLITASALRGEGEKCIAAGMDDFLAKPVTLDALRCSLARSLPAIAGFDALARLVQGDRDRMRRILGAYAFDTRADLDRWRAQQASGDRAGLERLAHKLKSGCAQVGATDAAEIVARVERDAPDPGIGQATFDASASRALARMEALVVDIERALGGLSSPA